MSTDNALQRAQRYLDTAALVLNDGDFESAVSRAYYAMFYMARAALQQKGITPIQIGNVRTVDQDGCKDASPRRLYANPRQESSWRIPTSRNEIDITPKTHGGLRNQFGLHFIKAGTLPERLAEILNDAEDLRSLAEYAEERIITREDAEITLREAKEFVKRVGEFLNA